MATSEAKVDTQENTKKTSEPNKNAVKKPKTKQPAKAKDVPKKGPGQKALAAMREQLRKNQEEILKVEQEEEERIRKIEEAEEARELQLQREKERKEKKKLRDKERKQKLKAEGKFLTGKQLFERARARTLLESLQQGTVMANNKTEKSEDAEKAEDEASSSSESETETTEEEVPKVNVSIREPEANVEVICDRL